MIVQCASCQTRFKIGDDKVTERGVKVRCTKCATVFVVRKGDGAQPPSSATGLPAPAGAVVGPATVPPAAVPLPGPTSSPSRGVPAAAPAPASGKSRPPPPPPGLLDDLFGQLDLGASPAVPAAGAPSAPAVGAPSPEAVFGATPAASPKPLSSAATTGLESLFGNAVGAPAKIPAAAAPAPSGRSVVSALASVPAPKPSDPFEAALAGTLDLALGPLGAGGPEAPAPAPVLPQMPFDAAPALPDFQDPLSGLDLDAPSSPSLSVPAPALAPPPEDLAGSEFDLGLGLGDDGPAPPPAAAAEAPEPASAPEPAPATAAAPPVQAAVEAPVRPSSRAPAPEEKSLFTLVFNGLAFAALVAVIFLGFVIYRNGGKVDLHDLGGGLRGAFGLGGGGGALDLPVRVTGSGYYPTLGAEPLLFVAGSVENDGTVPRPVEVELDVIDGAGRTVAHGRAWPGRLPTPEDLYDVVGEAELGKLLARLQDEPAAPIAPRQSEPFVIVVPRPASGAEGCTLRVRAHPAGAAAAAPGGKPAGSRAAAVTAAGPSGR